MRDKPRSPRLSRWRGLVGLSLVRLRTQFTKRSTGRTIATVLVVGLTIGLLLLVTGVALALADEGVATDDDADVRIVPHDENTLSTVDGVERSRLGGASERTETIRSAEGVDHATPVLFETIGLQPSNGDRSQRVLAVGVVPGDESSIIAGLSTDALESTDTGGAGSTHESGTNVVLSATAAERLEASTGDELEVTNRGANGAVWAVATVEEPKERTDVPVVLVHLDELRTISGAEEGDLADRILVWGEEDAGATAGEKAYPSATIETTSSVDPASLFGDGLALATSAVALVVGIVVCSLVIATTAGLAVDEDRRTLAILATVGFSTSSRLTVVAVTTLVTTVGGALVGLAIGFGGIVAINELAGRTITSGSVALAHPTFVPYAFGVALIAGLIAVPYPLTIAIRTNALEEVTR